MTVRAVSDTVLRPSGQPWANTEITFTLRRGSFTASAAYTGGDVAGNVETTTDGSGNYTVDLWANGEGFQPSEYLVAYPGDLFIIAIPAGEGALTMAALREAAVSWSVPDLTNAMTQYRADLASTLLGDALIGYRDIGAGALVRTVHSRLADLPIPLTDYATGNGVTDDTTAIQAAFDFSLSSGRPVEALRGTFRVTGPLTLRHHANLSGATFVVEGADDTPALTVGTTAERSRRLTIWLPYVQNSEHVFADGWPGDTCGVRLINLYECRVFFSRVEGFTTGAHLSSAGSNGNVYNDYHGGHFHNNKINMLLEPLEATAWVNENNFYGGRYSYDSEEGTAVAGTRHLSIAPNPGSPPNNNVWHKPSIEGNTPEYHVEVAGPYNTFYNARWEAEPPKVLLTGADCHSNQFFYGYNAQAIAFTNNSGGGRNHWYSRNGMVVSGSGTEGVLVGINATSSTEPVFIAAPAGTQLNATMSTVFGAAIGTLFSRFKATADAAYRILFDHANGRIELGPGDGTTRTQIRSGVIRMHSGGADGNLIVGNTGSDANPAFVALKTGTDFDTDASTAYGWQAGYRYSKYKRDTDTEPRIQIDHSNQSIIFGPGSAIAPNAGIEWSTTNVLGMLAGDSLKFDGTHNGGHLILGTYHLWVDATGDLRISNGVPGSDLAGSVVGSQS